MRTINEIIVHCSATPEGRSFSAADIDRWHRQRGFSGIGYHYVVLLDGVVERGRPEEGVGAHCKGHNRQSIGVCYIGGLDSCNKLKDTRTTAQRHALLQLMRELKQRFSTATVHGHCEFAAKACPCFNAAAEYENV